MGGQEQSEHMLHPEMQPQPQTAWGWQKTSVSRHPRTGSGRCLPALSTGSSGCELLLAHAASQQGEEQMAAYPFTRTRLIISLPYSVYGVHPALLKPRQLEGTKITSLRSFLHRLTAPHSTNQGHNLHAQPAESMQM